MDVQRKLTTPEYKDIEERHRHAMIKQSTTACAVSDLEKYHAALDKALLRYHGLKIGEINKIIRELWVSLPTIVVRLSLPC
jgi:DNA repair protein RAD50